MKLENFITKITAVFSPIIIILNLLGGIVGGIWLIVVGQWSLVLSAFIFSIFLPFLISIPLLIVGFIAAGVFWVLSKIGGRKVMGIGGFITSFFQHLMYLFWIVLVFGTFLTFAEGHNSFPYILFGYSIAIGPFAYMASKESADSYGTFIAMFIMQFAYIVLALLYYLNLSFLAIPIILGITIIFDIFVAKVLAEESSMAMAEAEIID